MRSGVVRVKLPVVTLGYVKASGSLSMTFGTDYSCLAYLANLLIHALKLGPGFLEATTRYSNNTIAPPRSPVLKTLCL